MSMVSPLTYGITQRRPAGDDLDLAAEELDVQGYTLIDGGFDPARLAALRQRLDAVYAAQEREIGGADNLERIDDANVTRCPLAYDETFLELATHARLLELCCRVLGENFVLVMQNGVTNPPGQKHYQARWHRDLNYQHWVASQPLAIHALVCLDPFSAETGGTVVLPGTHHIEAFPSDAYVARHETTVVAAPGTILVANAMLYHRAGRNTSGITRRGVNHVIGRPFLAQQLALPDMLHGRGAEDPFLARYLGYRWNPRASVDAWRRERLSAAGVRG
jgi:ectoine hydroxylase-related dioxygenase (phytanoyl-CoA dioxygenase family)